MRSGISNRARPSSSSPPATTRCATTSRPAPRSEWARHSWPTRPSKHEQEKANDIFRRASPTALGRSPLLPPQQNQPAAPPGQCHVLPGELRADLLQSGRCGDGRLAAGDDCAADRALLLRTEDLRRSEPGDARVQGEREGGLQPAPQSRPSVHLGGRAVCAVPQPSILRFLQPGRGRARLPLQPLDPLAHRWHRRGDLPRRATLLPDGHTVGDRLGDKDTHRPVSRLEDLPQGAALHLERRNVRRYERVVSRYADAGARGGLTPAGAQSTSTNRTISSASGSGSWNIARWPPGKVT